MSPGRAQRALQRVGVETLDRLFERRHPGKLGRLLVRLAAPVVRALQPNDKWSTPAFLSEWAKVLDCACTIPLRRTKKVFIFTAYRGQFTRDIIMALLLGWRGHEVTVGYLPKLQSPIKEPVLDHPSAASFARVMMRDLQRLSGGRVKTVDLSPLQEGATLEHPDHASLDGQCRADMLLRTRREHPDMSDPDTRWAQTYYRDLGYRSAAMAHAFFEARRGEFDIVVLPNGASFENAQVLGAAKAWDVPVTTHEKFAFAKVVVINHGDAFFHFHDIDRIWNMRQEAGLSTPEAKAFMFQKAWDLLSARRGGKGGQWGWQYQSGTRSLRSDDIRKQLGIEDEFVLVCPNVPFDAGYEGWLDVFPSMRDWLVDTVRFLLSHGSRQIVVRAHPAETRPGFGKETIVAILAEAGIEDPRLKVLPGGSPINTYDLMPICHYAVVFASTTGVEIAMHGKAVLAGANVYYARCGIVHYGQTQEDYLAILARLDAAEVPKAASSAEESAELYFLFHYGLQWRYPYDKPSHVTALPPTDLVSGGDQTRLCETLDVLVMTEDEYTAALPDLMRIDAIARRWDWDIPAGAGAISD